MPPRNDSWFLGFEPANIHLKACHTNYARLDHTFNKESIQRCIVWVVFGEEILPCDHIQLKEQDQHLSCISGNIFFWWAAVFDLQWFNSAIEPLKQPICVHWIYQRKDMSHTAAWQQCMCLVKKSSEQMGTSHFLTTPWVAILTSFPVNRMKLNHFGHDKDQEQTLSLDILILCPFLGCSHCLLGWCGA